MRDHVDSLGYFLPFAIYSESRRKKKRQIRRAPVWLSDKGRKEDKQSEIFIEAFRFHIKSMRPQQSKDTLLLNEKLRCTPGTWVRPK